MAASHSRRSVEHSAAAKIFKFMITAKCTIYQMGLPGIDTPFAVECMTKATQSSLKARLLELQMGYWQRGDSKPKFQVVNLTPDSVILKAESNDCDFYYAVRMKKKTWNKIKGTA